MMKSKSYYILVPFKLNCRFNSRCTSTPFKTSIATSLAPTDRQANKIGSKTLSEQTPLERIYRVKPKQRFFITGLVAVQLKRHVVSVPFTGAETGADIKYLIHFFNTSSRIPQSKIGQA